MKSLRRLRLELPAELARSLSRYVISKSSWLSVSLTTYCDNSSSFSGSGSDSLVSEASGDGLALNAPGSGYTFQHMRRKTSEVIFTVINAAATE